MKVALRVEQIEKTFGDFVALTNVSLEVVEGEKHAIIGPNGAGKSTLFNIITSYLRPDRGKVYLFEADITGRPAYQVARSGLGRSFQTTNLFPGLTVRQNVQVAFLSTQHQARRFWGRAWSVMPSEAGELLDLVGILNLKDVEAGALSHGDQRALELAISLALRPRLLVLDEPTAGMDPRETQRTIGLIKAVANERGLTVLFSEHDMEVVAEAADRVTVLAGGEVLAEGSMEEVESNSAVQEIYLGKKGQISC